MPSAHPLPARGRSRLPLVVLLAAVLAAGAWWLIWPRMLMARLSAVGVERTIAPRLGRAMRYGECRVAAGDSVVPGATCAHAGHVDAEGVEALVADAVQLAAEKNPDALLVLGDVALLGMTGKAPDPAEAISRYDSALLITHDSAAVMTRLSAGYLVLAEDTQSADDVQAALDWAEWALELEPDNLDALFNRALALEALSADLTARVAWRRYLAADSSSWSFLRPGKRAYRREAEQRLRALDDFAPPPLPADGAGDSAWITYAETYPQRARKQVWEIVLADWGVAVLAGRDREADALLHRAGVVGQVLARRPGGDATVADEVDIIRAAMARGTGVRPIAAAHRDELVALRLINDFGLAGADSLLTRLLAGPLTRPQRILLSLRLASASINSAQWRKAEQALDSADAAIDTLRYTSEAGYSRWLRGLWFGQAESRYDASIRAWRSADAFYQRAGEQLNRASIQGMIADAYRASDMGAEAADWAQRSARGFRAEGASVPRHNTLRVAALGALSAGYHRAALDLAAEDVALAEEIASPIFLREAQLNRAVILAVSGDTKGAVAALAQSVPDSLTQGVPHDYFVMATAYVLALAQMRTHPDSVAATVEPLLRYRGSEYWRTQGLALRAQAAAATGDVKQARRDLDALFTELDERRTKVGGGLLRGGLKADVQPALLRTVRLLAERGDAAGSLRLLERGTAALSPIRLDSAALPGRVADGRLVIRPLWAGNVVLLWSQAGASLELVRVPVDSAEIAFAIRTVERGIPEEWNVDAELSLLYRVLVQPVKRRLGGFGGDVVFVADADLSRIPFTALLDSSRVPLVMDHPVWSAVSLAAAAAASDTTLPDSVAFFAPKLDTLRNPGLDPLPRAKAEVEVARRAYGSRVIDPGGNTPEAFIRALSRAEMVYFAGHAVADNLRPERSYLVLEPADSTQTGHLTAVRLDSLQIGNVQLIVLSACSTLGSNLGSRGFTGLSAALLDAGAGGVVGSLWAVPDSLTGEMMTVFHQRYLASHDPAHAMWEAQRAMLGRHDPARKLPVAWAGFRYLRR